MFFSVVCSVVGGTEKVKTQKIRIMTVRTKNLYDSTPPRTTSPTTICTAISEVKAVGYRYRLGHVLAHDTWSPTAVILLR